MRWSRILAGLLIAAIVASLGYLVFVAIGMDRAAPPALSPDASVFVGDRTDWLLDTGEIGVVDATTLPGIEKRLTLSDGKMPGVGLRYYEGAKLWLRFAVPTLDTDQDRWVIKLGNYRVLDARLVVIKDGQFTERDWSHSSPETRAGLSPRGPAFAFERAEIEGATVLLGFNSRGAMRANVTVETERAFVATEWRQAAIYLFLLGVMWALALYLLVIGARLGERSLVYAAGLAFTLGIFVCGVGGYVHAALLFPWPTLADVTLYALQPWPPMFWMLLAISYLNLPRRAPRLAGVLTIIALILPFQGILTLFTALGFPIPFITDNATPVMIGMVAGLAPVIWYTIRGDRRALGLLLAFTPIGIGSFIRVYNYLTPSPNVAFAAALDLFADMVVTMVLLAAVIVIDLQRREAALRREAMRSEARFRSFADIASDSYFEVDGQGSVANAAGRIADELGLVPGVSFAGAMERSARAESDGTLARIGDALSARETIAGLEVEMQAGEQQRWLSFNLSPHGEHGLRGTIADVTERVRQREGEARQSTLSALGQLASGVAHEVNNLLHPMVNLAQRVRDKHTADPEARKLLDLVVASGKHAGEIVAGVLNSFNPARAPGERRSVADALSLALATVRPTLPATIELSEEIAATEDGITVPPGEMLQVISNLLSNSIRAVEGTGSIAVRLERQDGTLRLSVADNGRGMPEDVRRRATEPFVTGRRDGTGLGLSVVANIVRGWGGDMQIDSTPDAGTVISITIADKGDGK